jgi:hypothetical protein
MNRIALLSVAALAAGVTAQSNVVPGLNGRLSLIDNLTYYGRRGAAHPNGEAGMAMLNEMCNPGSVVIPWQVAMSSNHPKFGFMIARVSGGRIEQISDWSYCKHAFTSTNYSGPCGSCQNPGTGQVMGINCADTYGDGNNADRYWLGPPSEINPWLGTWAVIGSYFDRGDPAVTGAQAIDGVRSLTQNQVNVFDAVKNRITVKETDLLTPGASYFYGIQLIHEGEAVANRGDNLATRGFNPSWNGSSWSFPNNAANMTHGSILTRWPGADLNVGQNGNDDGRLFVASVVTPLGGGSYHYEYAVHNVDNDRGAATFRLPIDAGAVASNFTFRDIDSNPLNQWTAQRVGNEIVFSAPANNPLNWNTIYNFGFDATFPPGNGVSFLDEARIGPGALTVTVPAKVPAGSTFAQDTPVGTGCGGSNCQRSFYEFFAPASAFDLANSQWSLTFNAGSYTLGPGSATFAPAAGTTLTLSDDSGQNVTLPFALPYPGGTTNSLWVCSNGFVSAGGNSTTFDPSVNELLSGTPRWAALWHDLNPGAGGQVRVESTASVVRITYNAVANFSGGGFATFQYQFFPNGNVNVIYQAVTAAGNNYLVGYSPGGGSADPGSWNISANLAGGLSLCTAPTPNVALASSARPVLGTPINLVTTNIPTGTLLGVSILSLTQYSPGIDLGSLGMPGCTLYAGLDVLSTFATPGTSASVPWNIPNVPSASGTVVMNQSATLTPGINAFGFATSNAVQLLLGTQ